MTTAREHYTWGCTARLRMAREYVGLGTEEMAGRIGMSRRSWQRIETGVSAAPDSLWGTIAKVHREFDREVDELVAAAALIVERRAAGELVEPLLVELPEPANGPEAVPGWKRSVVARALARGAVIDAVFPDDIAARNEMQEEEDRQWQQASRATSI